MKLIVWLGNPGKQYEHTRHNIGFVAIDYFLEQGKKWKEQGTWEYKNARKWEVCTANVWDQPTGQVGKKIVFLKPMEFMNRSGWAVSTIASFYKIEPKDILVIHDDIDLVVGKIQLKLWWSSAGHNWLKNIIEKLGTKEYWRLRIWVDRPSNQSEVSNYVLHPFDKEEKEVIESKMSEIEKCIMEFIGW